MFGIAAAIGIGSKAPENAAAGEVLEAAPDNLVEAEQPTPPTPLDPSAVSRGHEQMKQVARLGLTDTSRIFSQNCYEALAKQFDWHQLDRCGSFDTLARRWTEGNLAASDQELGWFQSESAAGRYLTAATAHGLPPGEADVRWAAIEIVSSKQSLPKTLATEATEGSPIDSLSDEDDTSPSDDKNTAELTGDESQD